MNKQVIIKKTFDCIDENYNKIKIIFSVITFDSKRYILKIFDSDGRHFLSTHINYTNENDLNEIYSQPFDISYCVEPNFIKLKNDITINICVITKQTYILYHEDDTYSEDEILSKITDLENQIITLKERFDLMKK